METSPRPGSTQTGAALQVVLGAYGPRCFFGGWLTAALSPPRGAALVGRIPHGAELVQPDFANLGENIFEPLPVVAKVEERLPHGW